MRQTINEVLWMVRASRAPRIRGILEFAEQEVVIPEGVHEGTKYRADTLPWQRLWLAEIDSGRWRRHILTACVQGGKTLVGWVIPILWHVYEWRENFGAGVPSMELAGDKWRLELLPAINASPNFRAQLPEHGKGSRGGSFESLAFRHGPTLKFLSGGGGDEKRSSVTLRGSAITEADRLDDAGEASREAAPIFQIEARSGSFGDDARLYAECTSTIKHGFVTREREEGSRSSIMCPCPHCTEYVCIEREHLVGWDTAESELEARDNAAWICPHCSVIITEVERREMNERGVLVHRGQSVDRDGVIHGPLPPTKTLGFRANAFNNLLWSAAYIAAEEWKAKHDQDPESAERKMRQWYWCLPIEPNAIDVTPLEPEDVLGTQAERLTRGVVPPGTFAMAGAADMRKRQLHFVVIAWYRDERGQVKAHVVDVGVVPVESDKLGTKKALLKALRTLRDDRIERGYIERVTKKLWKPGWFPIDAFWFTPVVRQFVRECKAAGIKRYIPSFGRGLSAEKGRGRYRHPEKETPDKPYVGEQFYVAWSDKAVQHQMIVNCDHWKTHVREGFATPADQAGAISVFDATTEDENKLLAQFAKEVCAEKAQEIAVAEKGMVTVYVNTSNRPNHFGDAMYNADAAGWLSGVRIEEAQPVVAAIAKAQAAQEALKMPDGRPFFITARDG